MTEGSSPLLRLTDVAEAIAKLRRHVASLTFEEFTANEVVYAASERWIEVISEASRHIPDEMKTKYPEIPWRQIADAGDILRHEYDRVAPPILWQILQDDLLQLEKAVEEMIESLAN